MAKDRIFDTNMNQDWGSRLGAWGLSGFWRMEGNLEPMPDDMADP